MEAPWPSDFCSSCPHAGPPSHTADLQQTSIQYTILIHQPAATSLQHSYLQASHLATSPLSPTFPTLLTHLSPLPVPPCYLTPLSPISPTLPLRPTFATSPLSPPCHPSTSPNLPPHHTPTFPTLSPHCPPTFPTFAADYLPTFSARYPRAPGFNRSNQHHQKYDLSQSDQGSTISL